MRTTELTLRVPEELAREAERAGLLTPEAIEKLLREALERRNGIDALFSTIDRLHAANLPPMTVEEIQAEVDAVRAERRALRKASGADRP